ncbi:MAG: secretion system protein [Pirellulaceae bacterium]|nr:MAG: secretion system protein [Pirellulaceae bacterium]
MEGNRLTQGLTPFSVAAVLVALLLSDAGSRPAFSQSPPAASNSAPLRAETYGRWSQPLRISQGDSFPTVSNEVASPSIQPVRPSGQNPAPPPQDDTRLPYQHRLPEELQPRPVTVDARQQQDRFIPKIIDPEQELNLLVGHPRILTFAEWATKPQVRLYLADENIVRWDIISDTEVAVVGLQPGTTVLTIWFNDPTADSGKRVLSFRVRVFEDPQFRATIADLERQIAELFPDSHVQLSIVHNRLVVRGQAKDAIEAAQILSLLAQTRGGGQSARDGQASITTTNVFVDRDVFEMEDQAAIRRSLFDSAAIARSGIINLLTIPGEQQVTLHVTLAEVNRSALRSIGANVEIGGSGDVNFVSLLLPNGFTAAGGGNLAIDYPDFRLALNALRDLGFARTLAEPNLTAINGQVASFRAGDTFPVPNAQTAFGGVGQSVSQQFVGVDVQFVPYIVDRDRIRLRVRGQVSVRDDEEGANIAGTNVPGTRTRDFFTTVELRDGQTLAMAGLIQTTLVGDSRRIPWLGDLPVVGSLFGNKNNVATEQELVVLVTPELTHPLEQCERPPLPGSDLYEPTDHEFYLGNRMESRRMQDFRSPVRTDMLRIRQFEQCCHDHYILGPSGYSQGIPAAPNVSPLPNHAEVISLPSQEYRFQD